MRKLYAPWSLGGEVNTFFVFSASVVLANLVSNLLYGLLDPRVRV